MFRGELLNIILVIGIGCSIYLAGTNLARYVLIIRECNISTKLYTGFENGVYISVGILRAFSYYILIWDAREYFKKSDLAARQRSGLSWIVTILVSAILAIATAVVSHRRDVIYVNACDNPQKWQYSITIVHAASKAFVLFSTLVCSLRASDMLYSAVRKWQDGAREITLNSEANNISDTVYNKFIELYNGHIKVGKRALPETKALKRWFALMYFMHLIFTLIEVVHILLISIPGDQKDINYLDLVHSILNISIYVIGFFAPYYTATWLHEKCQSYRKKMADSYLEIMMKAEVKRQQSDKIVIATYLCKPGNEIQFKGCRYKTPEHGSSGSSDEATPLVATPTPTLDTQEDTNCRNEIEEKYKKYCREALVAQGTNIITMSKMTEFDFIPSFLNIRIPLDSPGYFFVILLTIISVIFNFVH